MRKVFLDDLPKKYCKGANKNKSIIDWINSKGYKVNFIYDDIQGELEIINYSKSYLTIKYNNYELDIFVGHFQNCNLGNLLNKYTSNFKIEIGTRFQDDKRDIIITDREYRVRYKKNGDKCNDKWYKYHCNKCGWDEGWMEESVLFRGIGCSVCKGITVVEGINSIVDTNPEMVKFFQGGYDEAKLYTRCGGGNPNNRSGKIYPICHDCGRIKKGKLSIATIYKNHSIGCSCGDGYSYISKYTFNLLEQLHIDFETEKKFDWCLFLNPYKQIKTYGIYDFVIENKKLIIETDGGFHRKDNNMNGQTKEESEWLDDIKDKLANEQGYKVIRISDEGNIKQNILYSDLVHMFNFNKVDWYKCEEFALSNRVKEACELKRNNFYITTDEISNIIGCSRSTVVNYLKKGTKLGWCNYNPKETIQKSNNKVMAFKNKVCLDLFYSVSEIEKYSQQIFNTQFNFSGIYRSCTGERKQYRGYIFKYIKDLTTEEYIKYDVENKLKELHNRQLVQAS